MCYLQSNKTADGELEKLPKREREKHERRLARMAAEATTIKAEGLEPLLNTVDDWATLDIAVVRKYRIGRHRFFIRGRHTDCLYTIVDFMPNKRDEDDKPGTKRRKEFIRQAMADPPVRSILPPIKD